MARAPRRIVIAPDSFKESLDAARVGAAIAEGLRTVWPKAQCIVVPMADGGEGTVAAVMASAAGTWHTAHVTGPLGEPVAARFALLADGTTAVLELAAASGLELVPLAQRDPMRTTSFGTGELLLASLRPGVRRIVLGIGGSATVDGGAGLLQALGATLLDAKCMAMEIGCGGAGLERVANIDLSGLDPRLADCAIEVMCDVDTPLLGPQGAARVFGPQKGATPEIVPRLECGLAALADALERATGHDVREIPGGGAAGGVGAALAACLGARLRQGVRMVAELTHLEHAIRTADLVITGEGRLDGQTLRGKTPAGVAAIARRYRCPVIALAGAVGDRADALREQGIAAVFPVVQGICSPEQAFAQAAENLRRTATNVAALWDAALQTQSS